MLSSGLRAWGPPCLTAHFLVLFLFIQNSTQKFKRAGPPSQFFAHRVFVVVLFTQAYTLQIQTVLSFNPTGILPGSFSHLPGSFSHLPRTPF